MIDVNVLVDLSGLTEKPIPGRDFIADVVSFALEAEDAPEQSEVSVTVVDTNRIHELNARYRDVDRPTDVLSFPCDDPWEADGSQSEIAVGDIVVAPAVCAEQATGYGNTFEEELGLLLVHGTLHLLGYDHVEDDDAEKMQARERDIIAAWRRAQGLPEKDVLGYVRETGEADGR